MVTDSEVDRYDILKSESIMLIGEQHPSRVVWMQMYDATDSFEEHEIRQLMVEISQHITNGSVPSGSARKFLDGKLIYYEAPIISTQQHPRVYAIFTNQIENIYSLVKKAVEAVATRGGVYSAERFFNEMVDILESPDKLELYEKISTDQSLKDLTESQIENMDLNELGLVVSHLNLSQELDMLKLEQIYFYIYQVIQELGSMDKPEGSDPDEFLDAAYVVGLRYQESDSFHLALELYKLIIPEAQKNDRFDLAVASRIQICLIYKEYFPMPGDLILETLDPIEENHLEQTNNRLLEIYFCLLGHAYNDKNDEFQAVEHFKRAINVTEQDVNAPFWIAEAYAALGDIDHGKSYLKDASRYYLTAASIAFSAGDLSMADKYRNKSANIELEISNSIIHTALIHRMEMDHKDAEYRAWESLRLLIKTYQHSAPDNYKNHGSVSKSIIKHARVILRLPGKQKTNRDILDEIEELIYLLVNEEFIPGDDMEKIDVVSRLIEENIPIAPPTFMLLSVDGRLMTMGKITDEDGWENSDIEGTLLSGILSAIMSMITEVSDEESSLRTVDAGNMQIMIEQSDNVVAVLLVDRDIQEFRTRLVRLLNYINNNLGHQLKFWDGGTKIFEPVIARAQKLLAPSIVAKNMDN